MDGKFSQMYFQHLSGFIHCPFFKTLDQTIIFSLTLIIFFRSLLPPSRFLRLIIHSTYVYPVRRFSLYKYKHIFHVVVRMAAVSEVNELETTNNCNTSPLQIELKGITNMWREARPTITTTTTLDGGKKCPVERKSEK